jgi:pimeloyl-ACP methyl ester carboxylesterase
MARRLSRREGMLIAGLSLAAVLWLWHSWGTETPHAAAAAAKRADAKRELAIGKVPVVHMELLDKAVVHYDPAGRDLFKYGVRPPSWGQVKQMRAAAAAAAKAQKEAEERARIAEEERKKRDAEQAIYLAAHPTPPPPPQPPVIPFKFLGFVGPPNARIAALEQNDNTFVAKVGEVVQKDFRIDEIKYESLVISYVDPRFKGQVRELPLVSGK